MAYLGLLGRLLPWALLAVGLALFPVVMGPAGLLFTIGWAGVFLVARGRVDAGHSRGSLSTDVLVVLAALFAAYVGGWYVLPAAVAFAVADYAGFATAPPTLGLPPWVEAAAGVAAFAVAVGALGYLAWAAGYASASSTVEAGSIGQDAPSGTVGFFGANDARGVIAFASVAGLALVAAIGAVGHVRTGRDSFRVMLGAAAAGLAVLTVASSLSIGPWLAPSALLAAVAWGLGRPVRSRPTATIP